MKVIERASLVILLTGLALAVLAIAGLLWYSPEGGVCLGTLARCLKP